MTPAQSAELTRWLRANAHRLQSLDPDTDDDSDLEPLLDVIGDARVVAMGESMHRIHEFFQVRHRVFRFLARRAGFTALVMESGFAEGLIVDEWISHGGPGIRSVLERGVTYHFGKCQEMLDQVTWMRQQTVRGERRTRFYGADIPDSAASALPAVHAALSLLDETDPEYAAHVRATLLPLFDYLPDDRTGLAQAATAIQAYVALPVATRFELTARLADLVERMRARSLDDIGEVSGDRAARAQRTARAARALRAAETARSADAFLAAMTAGPSRTWPPANIRDAAMADTVEWILEREPRILLAAANGHVQRTPYSAPPLAPQPMATLGGHLAHRLGDDYVVIGSTYGGGSAWLHRPSPDDAPGHSTPFVSELEALDGESLDAALAHAAGDVLIDLRTATPGAAAALDSLRGTQNGPYVQPAPACVAFDAIVHIEQISPWHTWLDGHGLSPARN